MAAEWIPCGCGFIEADIIRWREGVWQKPRRSRGRAANIGDRVVIAEVPQDNGEWFVLLIRDCTNATETSGDHVPLLPKNQEARRERSTIEKGSPMRLLWSDEAARAALVTKDPGLGNPA